MGHPRRLKAAIVAIVFFAVPAAADEQERTLKGDAEGTTLRSMTVEGEDRIRIEFDRPELDVDIDPVSAPGLDWDIVTTLLGSDVLGLYSPLVERSRRIRSEYRPRPWLNEFREGEVARFRPNLKDVEEWSLTVADSRGEVVFEVAGKGKPPKEIGWNGVRSDGNLALPGLTYSYVVEAADEAGNRRNFAGDGFGLPPYRVDLGGSLTMLFPVADVTLAENSAALLEAVSRINQLDANTPVKISVSAPDYNIAQRVAEDVQQSIGTRLLGEPSRIAILTDVGPSAPQGGAVTITVGP